MNFKNIAIALSTMLLTTTLIMAMNPETSQQSRRLQFMNVLISGGPTAQNTQNLQELLKQGIGNINTAYKELGEEYPPLFNAVKRVKPEWVKILLESGAKTEKWQSDASPLHMLGNSFDSPLLLDNKKQLTPALKIIDLLLGNGADINQQDYFGRTLLNNLCLFSQAVKGGPNPQAIESLLNRGADPNIRDNYNRSPIKAARLIHGHTSRIFKLLENHIIQNRLFSAVRHGRIDKIKKALLAGAKLGQTDAKGDNVFHMAARLGNPTVFKYLLQLPVTNVNRYLNQQNRNAQTPMAIAIQSPELIDVLKAVVQNQK